MQCLWETFLVFWAPQTGHTYSCSKHATHWKQERNNHILAAVLASWEIQSVKSIFSRGTFFFYVLAGLVNQAEWQKDISDLTHIYSMRTAVCNLTYLSHENKKTASHLWLMTQQELDFVCYTDCPLVLLRRISVRRNPPNRGMRGWSPGNSERGVHGQLHRRAEVCIMLCDGGRILVLVIRDKKFIVKSSRHPMIMCVELTFAWERKKTAMLRNVHKNQPHGRHPHKQLRGQNAKWTLRYRPQNKDIKLKVN